MGCGAVFIRRRDLKQHLSKIHGLDHTITQIQLLNSWGYKVDEDKLVNLKISFS